MAVWNCRNGTALWYYLFKVKIGVLVVRCILCWQFKSINKVSNANFVCIIIDFVRGGIYFLHYLLCLTRLCKHALEKRLHFFPIAPSLQRTRFVKLCLFIAAFIYCSWFCINENKIRYLKKKQINWRSTTNLLRVFFMFLFPYRKSEPTINKCMCTCFSVNVPVIRVCAYILYIKTYVCLIPCVEGNVNIKVKYDFSREKFTKR